MYVLCDSLYVNLWVINVCVVRFIMSTCERLMAVLCDSLCQYMDNSVCVMRCIVLICEWWMFVLPDSLHQFMNDECLCYAIYYINLWIMNICYTIHCVNIRITYIRVMQFITLIYTWYVSLLCNSLHKFVNN